MSIGKTAPALTIAVALLAMLFVLGRMTPLNEALESYQGDDMVSLELALTPTRAVSVIHGWTSDPKRCRENPAEINACEVKPAAWIIVHWDWTFIGAYLVLMLAISLLVLMSLDERPQESPGGPLKGWARNLMIILPATIALADALENLGIYILLGNFAPLGSGALFSIAAPAVGIFATIKFLLLFAFAVALFQTMRINLQVLSLVRFSLLMLAVGIIAIFVPQWQEVLLAVAEDDGYGLSVWLGGATLIAAITTWYSARVIFMLKLAPSTPDATANDAAKARMKRLHEASKKGTARGLKEHLPRSLGLMIPPIVAIGLVTALGGAPDRLMEAWRPMLALAIAWALFFVFVKSRRWLAKRLYEALSKGTGDKTDGGFEFLNMGDAGDDFGRYEGLRKLPLFTKLLLTILLALNVLAFLYVWKDPLWVQNAGSAAVVLGAVGLMIPVGTWLVYWGVRLGVPILLLLLGLAALFSFYNDNHWVRLSADASSTDDAQEPAPASAEGPPGLDLRTYAADWARKRAEQAKSSGATDTPAGTPAAGDIPLFLVSAEGGGIRAAYWTAWVLGSLQDRDTRFAEHLFAISGVSGGSLGGAVFSAQMAGGLKDSGVGYAWHADQVLQKDFLAPTLATLIFPDLLQRFLPWPVFNDRAITLERSWENAWETAWPKTTADVDAPTDAGADTNDRLFTRAFIDLWREGTDNMVARRIPLLFLNSTVVETGNRLIMHPLGFETERMNEDGRDTFSNLFKDAVDGRSALGGEVPLSTAVHLSARFTYVSPAGSIQNRTKTPESDRNRRWVRLVDGGYFENSGAVTTRELLTALERYRAQAKAGSPLKRLHPFVIHISNDPIPFEEALGNCSADGKQCSKDPTIGHRGKQEALGEVLSPLWALLNARPARGYQAREALFRQMNDETGEAGDSNHVHFTLRNLDTSLPLGWVLSQRARMNMQDQLPAKDDPLAVDADCTTLGAGPCVGNCADLVLRKEKTVCDNLNLVQTVIRQLDLGATTPTDNDTASASR